MNIYDLNFQISSHVKHSYTPELVVSAHLSKSEHFPYGFKTKEAGVLELDCSLNLESN